MKGPALTDSREPSPGERASGHGVDGVVATLLTHQPLAGDEIWRVTLVDEPFGRLVRPAPDGAWHLLELGELTDAQLDAIEVAAARPSLW